MSTQKYTLTTSLLLPAAGLDATLLVEFGFINAYINDAEYERVVGDQEKDVFVLLKPSSLDTRFEEYCAMLRGLSNYLDEYDIEGGFVMFRFKLLEEWKHIKDEFLTSKYSKIDRRYVNIFFPQYYASPEGYVVSKNWQILTKAPELRAFWEEVLDTSIPEDFELWDKINPTKEVFRCKSSY